jgi:hypothetical protein
MGSTIGLSVRYSVEHEEPTRAIHEEVSTPITNESVEEVSTSKSTKKKKKDKNATSTWGPEEEQIGISLESG